MFVNAVWLLVFWSFRRPAAKNQIRSFQIGPPSVASYVGTTLWTRFSAAGVIAVHASLLSVVRREPLNALPPDFVIAFTTPPVKRPYSAEMAAVDVVVSWIASSMKRLYGVPRMLSTMTAPLTVKRLSYECPPDIVYAAFGPFWFTPGERATAER